MWFASIARPLQAHHLTGFGLTGCKGVIKFCFVVSNLLKNNYEEQKWQMQKRGIRR